MKLTGVVDSFMVRLIPASLRHRSAEEEPGSLWVTWCGRCLKTPPATAINVLPISLKNYAGVSDKDMSFCI